MTVQLQYIITKSIALPSSLILDNHTIITQNVEEISKQHSGYFRISGREKSSHNSCTIISSVSGEPLPVKVKLKNANVQGIFTASELVEITTYKKCENYLVSISYYHILNNKLIEEFSIHYQSTIDGIKKHFTNNHKEFLKPILICIKKHENKRDLMYFN